MTATVAPTTFLASGRAVRESFGRRLLNALIASRAKAAAREIQRHQYSAGWAASREEARLVSEFAKRYGADD